MISNKKWANLNKKEQKYLRKIYIDFRKIGRKEKTIILIILASFFAFGSVIPSLYKTLTFKMTSFPSSRISIPNKSTPVLLTFSSNKREVKAQDSFSVTVNLNSPSLGVDAADFVVLFDPKYLKPTAVLEGAFFKKYPRKKMLESSVIISGVATFSNNKLLIPKGNAPVVTISFTALEKTPKTIISFDRKKTIVASEGKNILTETGSLKIAIR